MGKHCSIILNTHTIKPIIWLCFDSIPSDHSEDLTTLGGNLFEMGTHTPT